MTTVYFSFQGHGCCYSAPQWISQEDSVLYAAHLLYVTCQDVKNSSLLWPSNLLPLVDTQMAHFAELFKNPVSSRWTCTGQKTVNEKHTHTKLGNIHFSACFKYLLFFLCHKCLTDSITFPTGATVHDSCHYYSWMTHQGVSFLKSANENHIFVYCCLFLYLKYPIGLCELNTNTSIDSPPLCPSLPSSSADQSDGSVNCMQLGDWLQHFRGKNGVSSPESLFHMNYYALYFVLNMHCVPYGTLKVIWQHFGAVVEQYTHTHRRCRAHTHTQGKAHTLISTSKLVCSVHTHIHAKSAIMHIHTHTHTLLLSPLCSHLLIHSPFIPLPPWIQKCSQVPPTQRGGTWSEYLMKKRGAAECFIKHLWRTLRIWVRWTLSWRIHLSVRHHSSTIRGRAASSASTLSLWIFNASFG